MDGEDYISNLIRENNPKAERLFEEVLMEGSSGAVFLKHEKEEQ